MKYLYITIAFILTYIWMLLPQGRIVHPFPFYKSQAISLQAYVDYLMARVFTLVLLMVINHYYDQSKDMRIVVYLFLGYVIDYLLRYNTPIAYYSFQLHTITETQPEGWYIPFSFFLLIGLVLIVITFKNLIWQ